MCLVLKRQSQYKPCVSKKDKTVYKVLKKIKKSLYSPYYLKKYVFNKLYKNKSSLDIIIQDYSGCIVVEEGLHSFTTLKAAKDRIRSPFLSGELIIVEGIIPKGSQYILGKDSEIVSNQLIITKILE